MGLEETSASLALRGSVIAHTDGTSITRVTFQVSNASQAGLAVPLTGPDALVSYIDNEQAVNSLPFHPDGPPVGALGWGVAWLSGSGPLLHPGERVEFTVSLTGLNPRLGTNREFTIEVKPTRGAVLMVTRTTPAELTIVVDLK